MANRKVSITYKDTCDIARHHGWIVAGLYWLTEIASWISIGHWLRASPRLLSDSSFLDEDGYKVKASWQDIVTAIYVLASILVADLAWSSSDRLARLGPWLAGYVLFDPFVYLIRVLWFDDLKPGIPDPRRGVWSHRRVTFLAIIAFVQTLILFPSIYRLHPRLASMPRQMLADRAFTAATSFSTKKPLTGFDVLLVSLAIFLLVIAIATTASMAYQRHEFAPKPKIK